MLFFKSPVALVLIFPFIIVFKCLKINLERISKISLFSSGRETAQLHFYDPTDFLAYAYVHTSKEIVKNVKLKLNTPNRLFWLYF